MTEPLFPKVNLVAQKYGQVLLRDFGPLDHADPIVRTSSAERRQTIVTDLSQVHEAAIRAKLIEMGWRAPDAELRCAACGTYEVDLAMTCHNSGCSSYATERVVYEGWKQPPAPPPAATHKLNADQTVAVATDVYFNPDMSTAPRGVKLQLIGEGGVAVYGTYNGDPFWQEWAPVPKRRKAP